MPKAYFAFGTTLANMTNLSAFINVVPHVMPITGGMPMPLLGNAGMRVLSGRLRRNGHAVGAWMFDDFETQDELDEFLIALFGSFTISSKELYVSTIDEHGFYSPFKCDVDCVYPGQTLSQTNGIPVQARFDLVGGQLQSLNKSANYTVTTADHLIYVDTSGGDVTLSLPAVAGVNPNVTYAVVKTSASNSLILDPNGSETFDSAGTKTVTPLNARLDYYTDGTKWKTRRLGKWAD